MNPFMRDETHIRLTLTRGEKITSGMDHQGFVAELNDINLFMIKNGVVFTPFANACLHGITRGLIIEICRDKGIHVEERNLSLTEFYTADEVFGTGTMGELTPVKEMDGRAIINKSGKQVLNQLREYFHELIPKHSEALPF